MARATAPSVVGAEPASLGEGAAGLDDAFDRDLLSHLLRHAERRGEDRRAADRNAARRDSCAARSHRRLCRALKILI